MRTHRLQCGAVLHAVRVAGARIACATGRTLHAYATCERAPTSRGVAPSRSRTLATHLPRVVRPVSKTTPQAQPLGHTPNVAHPEKPYDSVRFRSLEI